MSKEWRLNLKPCPREKEGKRRHNVVVWIGGGYGWAHCNRCGEEGPRVPHHWGNDLTVVAAIKAWNTRKEVKE